jgi:hypothetical protein
LLIKQIMADDLQQPAGDRKQPGPYPTECPACQQHAAKPKSATTIKGDAFGIRLDMLCGHCAHQWTYDKLVESEE